jgi:hypothetical protein
MELTVIIKTPELRYAVMNKTAVAARSLQAAGKLSHEAASAVRLTEDSENHYEMARAIATALLEAKAALLEYIVETASTADNMIPAAVEAAEEIIPAFDPTREYNVGDKVKYDGEYLIFVRHHSPGPLEQDSTAAYTLQDQVVFVLNLPSNYNGAAADALPMGIHDYAVNKSLYVWYKETLPEIAENYSTAAQAAMADIVAALYKRQRPARPTQS